MPGLRQSEGAIVQAGRVRERASLTSGALAVERAVVADEERVELSGSALADAELAWVRWTG